MNLRSARLAAFALGLVTYALACTPDDVFPTPPLGVGGATGGGQPGAAGRGAQGAAGSGRAGGGGQSAGGGAGAAGAAADAGAGGASGAAGAAGAAGGGATFTNPVFAVDFPDPFVLFEGGTYFAFSTNVPPRHVQVARSTDLATWQMAGDALPDLPPWAEPNSVLTWAPSVLKRVVGGVPKFVLYYTTRDKASNFQCIGRAVAGAPEGPYVDESTAPLVCQVDLCGSIDPDPFVYPASDVAYLMWKSDENARECGGDSRLWSQRLTDDGLGLLGDQPPSQLLKRDQGWERPLVENPAMVFDGGIYYLFYSANWWESAFYAVGYAICNTPAGPCEKQTVTGPLFQASAEALGPGGASFFNDGAGRRYMAYHAWTAPAASYAQGGARSLRIEPVSFVNGAPVIAGPTTTAQPLP
jgi:beta-xylosidase